MTGAECAPLAFIYDRCATWSHREMDMRLTGCYAHADRRGWVLAGRWLDLGQLALTTERPQFHALVAALRTEARHREVLCLVHNWGRLATDIEERLTMQQRIAQAGGWTATSFEESDRRSLRALITGGRR